MALKEKENLSYATTWMNLEDIMVTEIIQLHKRQVLQASTYMRYPNWSNSCEQKLKQSFPGLRRGRKELFTAYIEFQFCERKKFRDLVSNEIHMVNSAVHLKGVKMKNFMLCIKFKVKTQFLKK